MYNVPYFYLTSTITGMGQHMLVSSKYQYKKISLVVCHGLHAQRAIKRLKDALTTRDYHIFR